MKRKIAFLVMMVGLVLVVVFVVKFLTARGPKTGELRVDSNPTVNIFLNNKNIGRSPYKDKIEAGNYVIKLVPESTSTAFASWEGNIVVANNLLTYVNATLSESELSTGVDILWLEKITSKQSEISITTNPDGTTLLIDDVVRGVTPISIADITPGDHTVTVTSVGFQSRTAKIKMTPGYRLLATMKLGLASGGSQEALVTPEPTPSTTPKTATGSATTKDPAKPFVIIKETPTGFLRVRMEPDRSATEVGQVKPGEKYGLLDTESGWYQIKYDGTSEGWISGQYAEKVE